MAHNPDGRPSLQSIRLRTEYHVISSIGEGAFGKVMKARNNADGQLYAIKAIPFSSVSCSDQKLTKEVQILSGLRHNHIVRYYCSWIEPPCPPAGRRDTTVGSQSVSCLPCGTANLLADAKNRTLFIQTEFCENGNLANAFKSGLLEDRARTLKVFHGIVRGLTYVHEEGIAHGDLHCGNIFISNDGEAKIGDFGLSLKTGQSGSTMTNLEGMKRNDIVNLGQILAYILHPPKQFHEEISLQDLIHNSPPELSCYTKCLISIFAGNRPRSVTAREILEIIDPQNDSQIQNHSRAKNIVQCENNAFDMNGPAMAAIGLCGILIGGLLMWAAMHNRRRR